MNDTTCLVYLDTYPTCLASSAVPFYYSRRPTLLAGVSDQHLALAAPIIAYWVLSLLFHWFDVAQYKWMEKYRIHESAEVTSKNLVTRWQVVQAVVFQQIIQTALGLFWVSEDADPTSHADEIRRIGTFLQITLSLALGEKAANRLLESSGANVVYLIYWWVIPTIQMFAAIFFLDTWQYFLHRAMHVNKFLYKHFHSWHHRLYVPYAFGSLYNHPVEGFLLDSLGAALAEYFTGMTIRQAMLLFTISSSKTVDDHCGYRLPFDPLQLVTSNNADYHDIHHQIIGIKSNFSQPFFIHWDVWLGTRMTREDIRRRKEKSQKAL